MSTTDIRREQKLSSQHILRSTFSNNTDKRNKLQLKLRLCSSYSTRDILCRAVNRSSTEIAVSSRPLVCGCYQLLFPVCAPDGCDLGMHDFVTRTVQNWQLFQLPNWNTCNILGSAGMCNSIFSNAAATFQTP